MDYTLEAILEEMKMEIDKWLIYISDKEAEKIVKRTTLQAGIHGYALLEYADGRVDVTDKLLDLNEPGKSKQTTPEQLTEVQVREQIIPELASYMQNKLNALPPAVLDYRFRFDGKFKVNEGVVHVHILEYVDEAKKQQLLEQIRLYTLNKLDAGKYPTKPLETFSWPGISWMKDCIPSWIPAESPLCMTRYKS